MQFSCQSHLDTCKKQSKEDWWLDCSFVLQMSGYWSLSCDNYMVMALGLEISKALIYITHEMQINSWTVRGPVLASSFGFLSLLLSTHVIYPFHQTLPYSVICGHFGLILFLNHEFGDYMSQLAVYIYVYKLSGPELSKTNWSSCCFPGCSPSDCLLTPPISLFSYPQEYLHLREDKPCGPSPPAKHRIKLRCATAFQGNTLLPSFSLLITGGKERDPHSKQYAIFTVIRHALGFETNCVNDSALVCWLRQGPQGLVVKRRSRPQSVLLARVRMRLDWATSITTTNIPMDCAQYMH